MLFFLFTCFFFLFLFSFFSLFTSTFNFQLCPSNNVMWFLKTSLWTSSERPRHCRPVFLHWCVCVFLLPFSSVIKRKRRRWPTFACHFNANTSQNLWSSMRFQSDIQRASVLVLFYQLDDCTSTWLQSQTASCALRTKSLSPPNRTQSLAGESQREIIMKMIPVVHEIT